MRGLGSFYRYIFGSVRIKLYGDYCERLINIMAANGISFYSLKKREDFFEVTLLKDDFKKLRSLRKLTGVKIRIKAKRGLPFILRKYRYRYGILLGAFLFLLILNFISTRMWMIKVDGNIAVPDEEIIATVEGFGIYEGISMEKIDVDVLKQQLVANRQDIAWASLNKQGSILEINITEVNGKTDNTQECNLVAGFDGVIKHIDVQSGTVEVKVGDTVTKGQLLVSGTVDFGSGTTFTSAKGKIIAHVNARETEETSIQNKIEAFNGKNCKRYVLEFLGLKLPLYLGRVKGEYNLEYSKNELTMFGGKIPATLTEFSFKGKNIYFEELSSDCAKILLKEKIQSRYKNEKKEIISMSNEKIIKNNDSYVYTATVDFYTDICVISPIFYETEEK